MNALFFFLGVVVVMVTALDIFQAVLVPRPTSNRWRPSTIVTRYFWIVWVAVAHRIGALRKREDYLGAFAPTVLVTLLISWISVLVFGYGLMFYALRSEIKPVPNFGEALYFAGTSMLTIGYGDFAPITPVSRLLALIAGASGLGAFAIITAFLFAIFGAYQQREAFVVMFSNRAGSSTVDMIATHSQYDMVDNLLDTIRASQTWLAQVSETHLAYPILTFFRSTHDDISWIAVVGTILDASTLAMTTFDIPSVGEALIANRLGRRFVDDFSAFFNLDPSDQVGIERAEFDVAYAQLHEAGVPLRDRELAWNAFAALRSTYAGRLNRMARLWQIPPAHWIGDRSLISDGP